MRFENNSKNMFLLVVPIPDGWEVRITCEEGYETIHLSTEQMWKVVELIHDVESIRSKPGIISQMEIPPKGKKIE